MTLDKAKSSLTVGAAIESSPVNAMHYYPFHNLLDVILKLRFSGLEMSTIRSSPTSGPEEDETTEKALWRSCLRLQYELDEPHRKLIAEGERDGYE